ncbi:MAG: hypothetical protein V4665_03225 [Patescibacteria group bacterium]
MKTVSELTELQNYIIMQAQREISMQILFALAAFDNISKKGEGNILLTFSSIHSFLTHCANVSKLLWSSKDKKGQYLVDTIGMQIGKDLADVIEIPMFVLLQNKSFRNDLDHYDQRMVKWINEEYPKHKNSDADRRVVSDLTIGDKNEKGGTNALHLRNYDPMTKIYTYAERDLDLGALQIELLELQKFLGGPYASNMSKT